MIGSDAGVPFVIDVIFPIASLAAEHGREAVHGFDPLDVFCLLVAELTLNPAAQRAAGARSCPRRGFVWG